MNKSWRSAWCKKAELSDRADSDTTKEAPPWRLCTTSVWMFTRKRSLLREGRQWPYPRSRFNTRHTIRVGHVDEDASPAVDSGHGSDHLHGLDLRSSQAACRSREGGASADATSDCGGQEKERPHRCQKDCRLPALRFPAGVLHGLDGDSRTTAHLALSEPVGPPGGTDEEQNRGTADGSRCELQQTEAPQGRILSR